MIEDEEERKRVTVVATTSWILIPEDLRTTRGEIGPRLCFTFLDAIMKSVVALCPPTVHRGHIPFSVILCGLYRSHQFSLTFDVLARLVI